MQQDPVNQTGIGTETPRDEDANGKHDTTRSIGPAWTYYYYDHRYYLISMESTCKLWSKEGHGYPARQGQAVKGGRARKKKERRGYGAVCQGGPWVTRVARVARGC